MGSACCWLKSMTGARVPRANCSSGTVASPYRTPVLTRVSTIAADAGAHLRDPSAVVRDASTGLWHFFVDYIPLSQNTQAGWHAYLHHYSAPAVEGPWTSHGLALPWSSDAGAFDSWGTFSPSVIFSSTDAQWYLFYSGVSLSNYSATLSSAQLVASAPSPDGPWTKLGLVAWPTGAPPAWAPQWNARRCDSGRAMVVGGRAGYWTKGVRDEAFAQEGAYFPLNASSFSPPFEEWPANPVFPAADAPATAVDGYENCEFFRGPDDEPGAPWLHVICQDHGQGQPHFVTRDALRWEYVGVINTAPALEPTPVYDGTPGDGASVSHFIARANGPTLHIDLFALSWV